MKETILAQLKEKKIVILGFGKEGISSYRFFRKYFPESIITIADKNEGIQNDEIETDPNAIFITGDDYDRNLNDYDLILKSPGVNLTKLDYFIHPEKITSQTDLFLQAFSHQVIGVTGTKGKSSTASLIYRILQCAGKDVLLSGNIGVPFFDIVDDIKQDTIVVGEFSAHQLEYLHVSPHIAILLNLYQEHLDHFISLNNYMMAKLNITAYQQDDDYLIYDYDDLSISKSLTKYQFERIFLPFSRNIKIETGAYSYEDQVLLLQDGNKVGEFELGKLDHLPGVHNYKNIMAAILAVKIVGISEEDILQGLKTYKPLEHRIEYVGTFRNIRFYNDSISTIPEATIAAVNTLRKVETLILGGFDRGIDYSALIAFLPDSTVKNVIFTGPAGERILAEWKASGLKMPENILVENNFTKIVAFAYSQTNTGKICLLSPAASSYNQFENFEERGRVFKSEVRKQGN